jgi:hypothetical protein
MKSPSNPGFTVVDRRGQNHTPEPEIIPEVRPASQTWEDVDYLYTLAQHPQFGMLMLGRAVGVRSDGKPFMADYVLFPRVTNNTIDWRPHSKKRLDTFLNCECSIAHGPCAVHKLYLPKWLEQDLERMQRLSAEPVSRALEALHHAELAKQKSNLVVAR